MEWVRVELECAVHLGMPILAGQAKQAGNRVWMCSFNLSICVCGGTDLSIHSCSTDLFVHACSTDLSLTSGYANTGRTGKPSSGNHIWMCSVDLPTCACGSADFSIRLCSADLSIHPSGISFCPSVHVAVLICLAVCSALKTTYKIPGVSTKKCSYIVERWAYEWGIM